MWQNNKGFILFLGLMFVLRSAVADWSYIPSSSMNPTLIQGDRVGVNKLAYSLRVPFTLHHLVRWGAPARGDVITFDSPLDDVNLIKRVVAIAGDTVEMRDNTVIINGQAVPRQLIQSSRLIPSEMGPLDAEIWQEQLGQKKYESARLIALNRFKDFDAVQVPAGQILVLGDSRDNSNDSRFIGFIDVNRITGRAERVVMSHDPESLYMPRSGRWWLAL
ncbi:MAG TPA: signal peptidase I [Burkholderiaceae bacterium]|nr:signal peptidase I [Burkholderiaceae bacterium]